MAEPLFDRISQATTSLKHLLGKAVLINKISPEKFDLSFTRILVAFHVADDPISHWFKDYVEQASVAFDDILAYKKLDHEKLEEIAKQEPPEEFPKRPPSMTSSAKIILTKATKLMQDVSRGEEANHLDVHHLMGAYIYYPGEHESYLKRWKFDSEAWSNAFLTQIKAHFPDEYDRWTDVHTRIFGNPPTPVPEPMSGPSTHIARDLWTVDDELGYDAYAYAIYRFLTHLETKPPLTISIQAPWGGGKTSLMRMIQERLDPEAVKYLQEQGTTPSGGADEQRTTDKLKVKQVRDELKNLIRGETPKCLFSRDNISRKDKKILRKFLLDDIGIDWAKDAKIEKSYLFSWDNISGKDDEKLRKFLKDDLDIGWTENAEIRKSNDGKTISISKDENSVEIKMDEKKKKAILKISDGRTHDLKVKTENGKLNIYEKSNDCTTINIYNKDEKNSAKIIMDVNKGKATLEIHDGCTYDLKSKKENGKLSILYEPKFRISDDDGMPRRLTIWFNVWEYESTEQVWAGLADAIVRQFAKRLEPIEREKFLLHLHLQRLDADKIRQRIWTLWLDQMSPWLFCSLAGLVVSILLAVTGAMVPLLNFFKAGWVGSALSIMVAAILAVAKYFNVGKEPARISFSEYVNVPDYSAKLGFVHHVMEDLQRVFKVISDENYPMVIFIDDLDRCSPEKVADVVEAINLFLGGEFQNCMFVLGMDPEMVAAALDEAHSKVIAKLPADATDTPIGWRFMNKFVQLPFVIPPAEVGDLENYARSLLSERRRDEQIDKQLLEAAEEAPPELEDLAKIKETSQELAKKHNLNDDQQLGLKRILDQQASFRIMDHGIDSFSDQDPKILELVLKTAPEFSSNPRELKRFFNLFRFLFFLKWARKGRGQHFPNDEQLRRWIVLSMKWPEVVLWLRRSYSERAEKTQTDEAASATATRLRQLENFARSNDLKEWQYMAKDELLLEVENTPWIADKRLMEFFYEECNSDKKNRLSDAAGKGLW